MTVGELEAILATMPRDARVVMWIEDHPRSSEISFEVMEAASDLMVELDDHLWDGRSYAPMAEGHEVLELRWVEVSEHEHAQLLREKAEMKAES